MGTAWGLRAHRGAWAHQGQQESTGEAAAAWCLLVVLVTMVVGPAVPEGRGVQGGGCRVLGE